MNYKITLSEMELCFLKTMIDQWYGTAAIEDNADPAAKAIFLNLCERIQGAAAVGELEAKEATK